MSTVQSKTFSGLAVLLFTLVFASLAVAQSGSGNGPYTIGFFTGANAGLPDAQMHIVNPGSTGGFGNPTETPTATPIGGDLCANIYVFDPAEEMIACCSCKISPNGLQGFSLATDLVNAPVVGGVPHAGDIKVVASAGGGPPAGLPPVPSTGAVSGLACDAGSQYTPAGTLETWITHVRALGTSAAVSEVANETAFLSLSEYSKLVDKCFAIETSASLGAASSRAVKSTAITTQDTTLPPVNCGAPASFTNGAGSATVSCPPFTPAAGETLTAVSLGYIADYQFGNIPGTNIVSVTFVPAGPAGVTWSPSSTTLMVMGTGSSGAEPTGTANATAGVTNANFAAAFNVNLSSVVAQGGVLTSSGAVTVTYTFGTVVIPPPPPNTGNCICDPTKAF